MFKITLRLYRHQVGALLEFLPHPANYSFRQIAALRIEQMILLDYRSKITANQVFTWKNRPTTKAYAFTLPLPVARALWSELQLPELSYALQEILGGLDKQLKDLGLTRLTA
ncbi:hypothetical protein [Spirosoma sp.]|uniref:hypothetical protein n=1 Tax=Spirosoma sp. TaxID=1899569 RepID=UPI002604C1E4|nr:hypothetical protein [Spirosoma sp.]MCX6216586.1 hypothetical protein [Spirosoma sp.]